MRTLTIGAAIIMSASTAADASSTQAWSKLARDAVRRCMQISHFNHAVATAPVVFSDRNGQVAILVTGTFPQAALKGARGSSLCLFDRRTRTAEIQEADGWQSKQ